MTYIHKRTNSDGSIGYRVQIRIKGMPTKSATFPTRKEGQAYALKKENELRSKHHFPRQESKERTFLDFYSVSGFLFLELGRE